MNTQATMDIHYNSYFYNFIDSSAYRVIIQLINTFIYEKKKLKFLSCIIFNNLMDYGQLPNIFVSVNYYIQNMHISTYNNLYIAYEYFFIIIEVIFQKNIL